LHTLRDVPGAPVYADLRARALVIELEGIAISIAGLDDLIAMKRQGTPSGYRRHRRANSNRRGGRVIQSLARAAVVSVFVQRITPAAFGGGRLSA